jgi:predicted O-methyltransferase YrrM
MAGNDLDVVKTWNKPIDFLFIDTSHTYEQTTLEIQRWFPLVRKGGQIAMHDTAQEDIIFQGCRKALDEFLLTDEGKKYSVVHLLDTKIMGMSILNKL